LTLCNEIVKHVAYVAIVLQSRNRWRTGFRLIVVSAAAAVFALVISAADLSRVAELVGAVGFAGLVVIFVPQVVSLVAESYGWKLALRVIDREVGIIPLLRVRIATEALSMSLPGGVLLGESAKPLLLSRHCGLSVTESVAAMVARKYLLVLSQAFYVLAIVTVGFEVLRGASPALLGGRGLEWIACGAGVVLAMTAFVMAAWLRQSAVARGLFAMLRKLRVRRLAGWLDRSERRFSEADQSVSAFFGSGPLRHALPAAWFALGWLVESVETFVILRVLGADVGFVEVASLEILLTLVRHVVFVVPAGLGVQDLGYVAALGALGVPDAASLGAAFVLVKRTKELFWIALGYALLATEAKGGAPSRAAMGTSSA
jgi:uncharacterized membrane protein YbhN (UPF0104 family)